MTKLFLASLLFLGCVPAVEPRQQQPEALRVPSVTEPRGINSNCYAIDYYSDKAAFNCYFSNNTYSVSSNCIQLLFYKRSNNQFISNSKLICSEWINPLDETSFELEIGGLFYKKLTGECGENLHHCYMRIDPVSQEKMLP